MNLFGNGSGEPGTEQTPVSTRHSAANPKSGDYIVQGSHWG